MLVDYNNLKENDEFIIPKDWNEESTINSVSAKYSVEKSDFITKGDRIIYKPEEKKKTPIGHDIFYVWNNNEKKFIRAFRPMLGFSEKYLNKNTFLPQKNNNDLFSDLDDTLEQKNINDNSDEKSNKSLHKAKNIKNDEFYTRIDDVVNELKHYKDFLKGKIIYCPCDKVYNFGRSAFAQYFISEFHRIGIKKLICTQYNPSGHGIKKEINFTDKGLKWVYNGELPDCDFIDESEFNVYPLNGDGSFDSQECIEIMRSCDVVITNPPFSLFRNFLNQIFSLNKKFLIVGNKNAITYKDVFAYIQKNMMWLGYNSPKHFEVPLDKVIDEKKQYEENGKIYQTFGNIGWFTNIEHNKRTEMLYLSEPYIEENYEKYDNYDAIEVPKIKRIPKDYNGVMGVPITFLDNYCPDQFEIVKFRKGNDEKDLAINGYTPYFRILIRKK